MLWWLYLDGKLRSVNRLNDSANIPYIQQMFVFRYGGIQLGPDRFKHITNAARRALVQAGFIK